MDVVDMKEIGAKQLIMKVQVWCAACGRPFVLHAKHGYSTYEPSQNNDGTELRVPIEYPEDLVVAPVPTVVH